MGTCGRWHRAESDAEGQYGCDEQPEACVSEETELGTNLDYPKCLYSEENKEHHEGEETFNFWSPPLSEVRLAS